MVIYEEAANEIIPAIRSRLANTLINKYNLKEEKVAELLGVAQAAISKYKTGKYSEKIKEIEGKLSGELIDKYARILSESGKDHSGEVLCSLCQTYFSFKCKLIARA